MYGGLPMMIRLPIFHLLILIVCLGFTGCSAHPVRNLTPIQVNNSYGKCVEIDYKPIQVIALNDDLTKSVGSGFYIKNHIGKHLIITNAHVVQNGGHRYHRFVQVLDQNLRRANAKVVAVRHSTYFAKIKGSNNFTLHKMADVAILEVEHLPNNFEYTPLALSNQKSHGIAYSKGLDYNDNMWEGCFGIAYEGENPHLISQGVTAAHSFSGTPVLNNKGEVLGMITAKGNILFKKKELPLFVKKHQSENIITSEEDENNARLFAMVTSFDEIRTLLHENYNKKIFQEE